MLLLALRQFDGPLTSNKLAERLMAERGLNTADKARNRTMVKRVGSSLRDMRAKGRVRSEIRAKREMLWQLK